MLRRAAFVLACLVAAGCARPLVYPIRKGPEVAAHTRAVLWTFVSIARAPQATFDFHLRLEPALPCPLVVWEWGDGDLSARESDCNPGDIGPSVYDSTHTYRRGGEYTVTASVIEAGRVLARAEAAVIVLPGPGQ